MLQIGSAGAAAAALTGSPARAARVAPRRSAGKATNIVFMVADGMSYGTLTLADACHRERLGRASNWVSILTQPSVRRATAFTYSADSLVTDSAAGATAWGIGEQVQNHRVCVTPDNRFPTPLWVQAEQQGKSVGLVTTTTITHATPAGFIANVPDRNLEGEIAIQLMQRGVDVALGGGRSYFPDTTLALRPGITVAKNADQLRAADPAAPLLGLFTTGHMSFTLDRPETQPDLEEMTRAALARLFKRSNGFVLLVEGGRVDHAAHSNDAAALVHEQLAFDRALGAVWELTRDRSDTLVIVTTDHGNANPALTTSGNDTARAIRLLNGATRSFESMLRETLVQLKDDKGVPLPNQSSDEAVTRRRDTLAGLLKKHLAIELNSAQRDTLALAIAGKPVDPFSERQSLTSVLGSLLANYNYVSFLSANHTSDMVEVTSWGPGSERIPAMINNYDLHDVVVKSLDLAPAKPV
jgi:alkaline phosphatase